MKTVTSRDGTPIAYEQAGQGQPVILVDGALCSRAFGPMAGLSALLEPHFTVFRYDRRGRNESGDTKPYTVEREIEDIEALINEAGGSAFVYGTSSGAALAMEAALKLGNKIKKLAMYEPPYNGDPAAQEASKKYSKELNELVAAGRPGDAAAHFMSYVGTPAEAIEGMRQSPMWPMFEAVGHTLAYDNAVLGADAAVPTARAASVAVPTLLMNGGAGFPFMHETADALAKAIPNAQRRTLEGQTHDAAADVVAPALIAFFTS